MSSLLALTLPAEYLAVVRPDIIDGLDILRQYISCMLLDGEQVVRMQ